MEFYTPGWVPPPPPPAEPVVQFRRPAPDSLPGHRPLGAPVEFSQLMLSGKVVQPNDQAIDVVIERLSKGVLIVFPSFDRIFTRIVPWGQET